MCARARALVRPAQSLPTAHPRASSPPTDSPFRMSHRRASKHKKSDKGSDPRSQVNNNNNNWMTLSKVSGLHTTSHPGWSTSKAERGNCTEFCSESQMCLQDVPRDWVCNPSYPLFPSPFLLSWLMITHQQTATPPLTTQRHFLQLCLYMFSWLVWCIFKMLSEHTACIKIQKRQS